MDLSLILDPIEVAINAKVKRTDAVAGGSIGRCYKLTTQHNKYYFLKIYSGSRAAPMIGAEVQGLTEINKSQALRVPQIISHGQNYLLLEYIQTAEIKPCFWQKLAHGLVKLHSYKAEEFGFEQNNFIGTSPQMNSYEKTWVEFFWNNRIEYQWQLARANSLSTHKLDQKIESLKSVLPELFQGIDVVPSLLHGDLWSGNYLCDQQQQPVLIDPAVYYGHFESDLAMTKLFGGFANDFYARYFEQRPQAQNYAKREALYQLYHILNHLNLFGSSYYQQSLTLLSQIL